MTDVISTSMLKPFGVDIADQMVVARIGALRISKWESGKATGDTLSSA